MKRRIKTYSGTKSQKISEREIRNRTVARKAAADGMVLIENNGVLPLENNAKLALFGSGATYTVKGGTGSGDVNEREVVNIYEGIKNAGFTVVNEKWIADYKKEYEDEKEKWKETILNKMDKKTDNPFALIDAYVHTPFVKPLGRELTNSEIKNLDTDVAIYVISRNAGEGADRTTSKGDYYLTDEEKDQIEALIEIFPQMIIVLNCGGPIDLSFLDEIDASAVVSISQPGMEGGNAFADIISGAVTPSGKMTDTWAKKYDDYPNAATFSHNNGNVDKEYYEEGIYVGYRYFDTFDIQPHVPFGFGLSYTDFEINTAKTKVINAGTDDMKVVIEAEVSNVGDTYSGREVVQVYVSCPQTEIKKEYQRLCAFYKTPLLKPGESCKTQIEFPISQMASFNSFVGAYVLEKGNYVVAVGNSSSSNKACAVIALDETVKLLEVDHICPLNSPLKEIEPCKVKQKDTSGVPVIAVSANDIVCKKAEYIAETPDTFGGKAGEIAESLSVEQLLSLTSGDPGKGQDVSNTTFGESGLTVPGAAGETHTCASDEPWNLASIVLADGPAGIRLAPKYPVMPDGSVIKPGFAESIEHGMFAKTNDIEDATYYYQYCTAIPVGTMLAQTWDTDLLMEVGRAVAEEMEEFGVTLWLAPGLNIHRNPLCGRNFEYYSEDPLVSGIIAAAITMGVQSRKGTGTTIKHFACNNQEENRHHSDSIVSERALREIYLHGFEIAIKHSQPMAIMTSYNLVNGLHTANSYDLITKVARQEWGFEGLVMSDWTTTGRGGSNPVECMKAGNDLIMPGSFEDIELIRKALSGEHEEKLDIKEMKKCVTHIANIVLQSLEYEGCESYLEQFDLKPFMGGKTI